MLILFMEWNIGESVLVQDHLKSKVKHASLKLANSFNEFSIIFIGCRIQNCYLTQNKSLVKNFEQFDAILFPLIKMMSTKVNSEQIFINKCIISSMISVDI